MFFKLHSEGKIGFKQLTDADLGRAKGRTTHIGLFGDILTFLPDKDYEEDAMFLYKNKSEILPISFDRINRKSGRADAPKIKTGGRNAISVVSIIKNIANNPIVLDQKWYILWFGLTNESIVVFLFNNQSTDFNNISKYIDLSRELVKGRINSTDEKFSKLLDYLEKYINTNSIEYISELEIASQVGSSKKYRTFDLEKANEWFKDTGKKGETLIAEFLDRQKLKNQIFNYTWYNQSRETGLPYDFSIQYNNQNIVFLDVKSTGHAFERPIIFSNKEIECIVDKPYYHIYRVFDLSDEKAPKLKICENSKDLAKMIVSKTDIFQKSLEEIQTELKETKFSIEASHNLLSFGNEISLNI